MKKTNLSWVGALLVFALLLWCTAATPGTIADPASYAPAVYSSMLSLLPPVVAIVLALNTKEVYTSLLVGIATGALLFANGNLELALNTLFFNEDGGMVAKLSDSSNVGILVFLVMLGILVALMNKAGGSAAFGRWASTHIHTRAGAQFATLILGVLIFVDDYFNCLTVGSVMRPVTDRQKVSRAKLAYLIDSTAAPVCIIAPVSSWAAAVTSSVPEGSGINGFTMFLRTIPYNYYALLTIVMSLFLIFTGTDYCSMKQHEDNARAGDLFTTADRPYGDDVDAGDDAHGHVIDLVAPVLVLIAACIFGLIYTGGFFEGVDFITAFSDCNASAGLVLGSSIALMFTGFCRLHPRGLQGHGQPHADPDPGLDAFRHDQPAGCKILRCQPAGRLRCRPAVPAAGHHLPGGGVPGLCHRHLLGHLLHPDPHRLPRFPAGRDAGGLHCGLPVRRCVRRPLLSHFRHHHHGLCRCALQPCEPCFHPAALRHYRRILFRRVLCDHRPDPDVPGQQRQPVDLADPAGRCHCAGAGGAEHSARKAGQKDQSVIY